MNVERQVHVLKRIFLVSTISLLICLPVTLLVNNVIVNVLFLLSGLVTTIIVGLIIITFILYWIGWSYTEMKLFYYRRQAENTKE